MGAVDWTKLQSLKTYPAAVGGVIAICLLMYVISIARWRLLLSCQDIHLTVRDASEATLFSLFLNSILPGGGFGGDRYRVAYVARRFPVRRAAGVLSVFIDRGLGFYALVSVAALVVLSRVALFAADPVLMSLAAFTWFLLVAGAASVGLAVVYIGATDASMSAGCTIGRFRRLVTSVCQATVLYLQSPMKMVAAFGLSLVIQCLAILSVVILGFAMGFVHLSVSDYVFAAPWGWIANLFPLTLGGIGVGEAAFEKVCHLLNAEDVTVGYATIFLAYRMLATGATLPGLIFWLLSDKSWNVFTNPCEATE